MSTAASGRHNRPLVSTAVGQGSSMPPSSDVFLSYPHKDRERVRALVGALAAEGLSVWLDESKVEAFDRIHDRVVAGIAGSRVLLAWYSLNYVASRPCQWELSAAWSCENGARVLVVNPEADDAHIQPRSLLQRFVPTADDLAAAARAVRAAVAGVATSIGQGMSFAQPVHHGRQLAGSNHFVGRAGTLWALHDALSKSAAAMLTSQPRSVVQLRGFGGVGKSVLAEEYALRFGAAYPGGIFWLKAYGDPERDRQIAEFASRLQVSIAGRPPAEIRAALAHVMAAGPRSLWIVDDAPSGLSADALSEWLSPHAAVPTLITTRDRTHSSLGVLIDVDVLADDESLALFEAHREIDDGERASVRELLDALGHHALAVEVAASYLGEQRSESIAGFVNDLRNPAEDVLEQAAELADTLPLGHSPSIVATLDGTIRHLGEPARDLLCLAACLATAPIPRELVEDVFVRLGTPGAAKALRMKAAKEADRYGLCRKEADPPDALSVHTLVARTALRHPASAGRIDRIRAAAVACLMERLYSVVTLGGILREGLLITHARALSAAPATAAEAALLVRVANTDLLRGDLETADRSSRGALVQCVALLGDDALETQFARSGAAMVLMARGESARAHEMLARLVPIFERALPAGHIYRVGAQSALALTSAAVGEGDAARRLAESALAACVAAHGEDHELTLGVKAMLGQILQFQGDAAGGMRLQQEVLASRRRDAGEADLDALTDEFVLAQAMVASGEAQAAAPVIERVAAVFERTLGADNVLTLSAQMWRLLANTGQEDADEIRGRAAALAPRFDRAFGGGDAAATWTGLVDASAAMAQGDATGARRWLAPMVEKMEASLGPRHAAVLGAKVSLAQAAWGADDVDGARHILADVLPLAQACLGAAHPCTVNAMLCLASCLSEQGDEAGARALWEQAIVANPAASGAKQWLALSLCKQAQTAGTLDAWEAAVAAGARVMGASDPPRLMLQLGHAQALMHMQDFARCRDVMRAAIEPLQPALGADDPTMRNAIVCLALALQALGEWEEAAARWEQVLTADRQLLGAADAQTVTTANCLFLTRWHGGQPDACRQIFVDYFETFCRRDPATLSPLEQGIRSAIATHTDWLVRQN